MAKKLISINLDEDLLEEIDSLAQSIGLSRSSYVNMILRGTTLGETSEAVEILAKAALSSSKEKKVKRSAKRRAATT